MRTVLVLVLAGAFAAGCASVPNGPSVMALPGSGKSFDQFRADDFECRRYARDQLGGRTADAAATDATVRSAAVGTVVGAAAGAAVGGHRGAGVGAGTGLLVGTIAGTGTGQSAAYGSQRRYDDAYVQCMYGRGQKVPVSGALVQSPPPRTVPMAPAGSYPPPPPGYPPPPPPR